jgi:uncharacterized protein (UPF0147 family)
VSDFSVHVQTSGIEKFYMSQLQGVKSGKGVSSEFFASQSIKSATYTVMKKPGGLFRKTKFIVNQKIDGKTTKVATFKTFFNSKSKINEIGKNINKTLVENRCNDLRERLGAQDLTPKEKSAIIGELGKIYFDRNVPQNVKTQALNMLWQDAKNQENKCNYLSSMLKSNEFSNGWIERNVLTVLRNIRSDRNVPDDARKQAAAWLDFKEQPVRKKWNILRQKLLKQGNSQRGEAALQGEVGAKFLERLNQIRDNPCVPPEIKEQVEGNIKYVAILLRENTLSPQANEALKEIGRMENFSNCTPAQRAYIKEYAQQMIEGGDKKEFALAVAADMVLLYQGKIDEKLPDEIKKNGDVAGIVASVETLKSIMEANGGDYKIINHYFDRQMASAEGQASQAMQYYLLTQRQDADDMENKYYFGGREPDPESKERYKKEKKSGHPMEGKKYNMYSNSPLKTYTRNELEAKFEKACKKSCGGDREKYGKTVTMYKAFTAIALDKMDFPGKNPDHTVTVCRGVNRQALCDAYPGYEEQVKTTGHATIKHAMGESTSIGDPIRSFNGSGTDTHTFKVPLARIMAPYCLHLFPEDGMYRGGPDSFWEQREFVCNLQGLEAEVKQN